MITTAIDRPQCECTARFVEPRQADFILHHRHFTQQAFHRYPDISCFFHLTFVFIFLHLINSSLQISKKFRSDLVMSDCTEDYAEPSVPANLLPPSTSLSDNIYCMARPPSPPHYTALHHPLPSRQSGQGSEGQMSEGRVSGGQEGRNSGG